MSDGFWDNLPAIITAASGALIALGTFVNTVMQWRGGNRQVAMQVKQATMEAKVDEVKKETELQTVTLKEHGEAIAKTVSNTDIIPKVVADAAIASVHK